MSRVEVLLVAVLIVIAVLLGIMFGGSAVWYLKPDNQPKVIESTTERFVCADGTIKETIEECPIIQDTSGETTIVCPPCNKTDFIYRKCDCNQCLVQCGLSEAGVTTTTLHIPKCDPCTSSTDCGTPGYSEIKCSGGRTYKIYSEPRCDEGCCKTLQEQRWIGGCPAGQRCLPGQGCVSYDDE